MSNKIISSPKTKLIQKNRTPKKMDIKRKKRKIDIENKNKKELEIGIKCFKCRKKLRITNNYTCKCNKIFCAQHRFYEQHECSFDHRSEAIERLIRDNPRVVKEKFQRVE